MLRLRACYPDLGIVLKVTAIVTVMVYRGGQIGKVSSEHWLCAWKDLRPGDR